MVKLLVGFISLFLCTGWLWGDPAIPECNSKASLENIQTVAPNVVEIFHPNELPLNIFQLAESEDEPMFDPEEKLCIAKAMTNRGRTDILFKTYFLTGVSGKQRFIEVLEIEPWELSLIHDTVAELARSRDNTDAQHPCGQPQTANSYLAKPESEDESDEDCFSANPDNENEQENPEIDYSKLIDIGNAQLGFIIKDASAYYDPRLVGDSISMKSGAQVIVTGELNNSNLLRIVIEGYGEPLYLPKDTVAIFE